MARHVTYAPCALLLEQEDEEALLLLEDDDDEEDELELELELDDVLELLLDEESPPPQAVSARTAARQEPSPR